MITLTKTEKVWILLCKGWKLKRFPLQAKSEQLAAYFKEVYAWDPEECFVDYKVCLANKLFDIYMKIREEDSNRSLKRIVFSDNKLAVICSEICGIVVYDPETYIERFSLDDTGEEFVINN